MELAGVADPTFWDAVSLPARAARAEPVLKSNLMVPASG